MVGFSSLPQSCCVDQLVDGEHAVDRRFVGAGHFGHDHVGEAAVAAEDRRRAELPCVTCTTSPSCTTRLVAGHGIGRHRRGGEQLAPGQIALGQADHDLDRVAALAAVRIADGGAAEQRLDGVVDVLLLDAEELEAVLVDGDAQARPRLADGIVDVDDIGHRLEDLLDLVRHRAPGLRVRAVDFGEQRRQHRRTGRHLDHARDGAGGQGDLLQPRAQIERDVVAGAVAVAARRQIEMQFAELGRFAHVIVPHQAVEVERRRRAGIGLDRAHLRHLARDVGDGEQRALGVLQRGALRQIDHHRHFRLVVERQQLHRHALGVEQHAHGHRRHADADEEYPGAFAGAQHRAWRSAGKAGRACLRRARLRARAPASLPGAA